MFGRKRKDEPSFVLDMELRLARTFFDSKLFSKSARIELVKHYGLAIDFAERYLEGSCVVTEEGSFLSSNDFYKGRYGPSDLEGLGPSRGAWIDIDDNIHGLLALRSVVDQWSYEIFPDVHFHYRDGGDIHTLGFDGRQLCVPEIRSAFSLESDLVDLQSI